MSVVRNFPLKSGVQKAHMARRGFSFNNLFFSMNSLRWVHVETYQRRIPIYRKPIR
jgi:hypothetical protein